MGPDRLLRLRFSGETHSIDTRRRDVQRARSPAPNEVAGYKTGHDWAMSQRKTIDPDAVLWSVPRDQQEGRPVLVLMHGYGSNEADLFSLVPYLPDEPVIAAIRAPLRQGPGFAWFPLNANEPGTPSEEEVDLAVRAVFDWLDSLASAPSLGLLGFSQGGAMALQLMRYEPRRFSYVVQFSGFFIGGVKPGDVELSIVRPPVFWGRGTQDPVIAPSLIARTQAWLPTHSSLDAHVYDDLGHSISQQELAEVSAFISTRL